MLEKERRDKEITMQCIASNLRDVCPLIGIKELCFINSQLRGEIRTTWQITASTIIHLMSLLLTNNF